MHIKYVEISDILSIHQVRLEFGDTGLILLDGWNFDDDTANGAGKTAILNSISFGLYGKFPRKVSVADILRAGTKAGYVKVGIDIDGTLYEVHRARPHSLKFYVNGQEKDMTQEEFEGCIRIGYSQYLISMYSAQTEGLKLISLNDAGKKDFFLRLMNLDKFDACVEELNQQLKVKYADKLKLEASIAEITARAEAYRESILDELELQIQLSTLDTSDLTKKLKKLEKIEPPDTSKFENLWDKLNEELSLVQRQEDEALRKRVELKQLDHRILKLSAPIKHEPIDCPHCDKSFVLGEDGAVTLESIEANRKRLLLELQSERKELLGSVDVDFSEKKQKLRDFLSKCKTRKAEASEEFNSTRALISELNNKISIQNTKASAIHNAIEQNNVLIGRVMKCNGQIHDKQIELNVLNEAIQLEENVLYMFSATGAPAYVLDSAVDVFNEKVAHYTSMIWPNASYSLQSWKETKSGEIRAKFSERLVINGKERSIGALSGGEHRCLSLAVDFAVVDVLETMFGVSLNPIMLDEPFNDLDASNRERVLELLEKISCSRQILVIDHASEAKAAFSNVIRIEKRGGISALA